MSTLSITDEIQGEPWLTEVADMSGKRHKIKQDVHNLVCNISHPGMGRIMFVINFTSGLTDLRAARCFLLGLVLPWVQYY